MKKFVSGLLIGILITLSITTFAAVELNIIPNPYKILIDGKSADVQGYNINGSTYLKLTDFVETGLAVSFDKDKKQIEITTSSTPAQKSITNVQTTTTSTIDSDGSIIFDPDINAINTDNDATINNIKVYKYDNIKYVYIADVEKILKNTSFKISSNFKEHITTINSTNGDITQKNTVDSIKSISVNEYSIGKIKYLFFTYEDWTNKIVPFIKEG